MYNTEPQFLIGSFSFKYNIPRLRICSMQSRIPPYSGFFASTFIFKQSFFQETAIFDSFCIVNNLQPSILVAYEARIWFI